jgi:hypothetical protein
MKDNDMWRDVCVFSVLASYMSIGTFSSRHSAAVPIIFFAVAVAVVI